MGKTALLFAGQGAQKVGMGKALAEAFPAAREWFEKADAILGYELSRICFEGPEETLTRTEHAQPAIYLTGWIAFRLLSEAAPDLEWDAAAGLSLGEFTALAAAGVFSFEDGLRLVRRRGELMQAACERNPGAMAAVIGLDEAATAAACAAHGAQIANLNCPGQIVISGEARKVAAACEAAKAQGARRVAPLQVAGAYHSDLMRPAQPGLDKALASVPINLPAKPVLSNVTARPHGAPSDIHRRLVDQLVSPVRWEESMRRLLAEGFDLFIELGPGAVLSGFMKRIDRRAATCRVEDPETLEATLKTLGRA